MYRNDNPFRGTHGLQLQSQLAVGDFEGSGDGLKVVDQHAGGDSDKRRKVESSEGICPGRITLA